ncbi:MAG TPA: (2Fe-2S)-binding protein [Candidatus Aquilonibacter sp.]
MQLHESSSTITFRLNGRPQFLATAPSANAWELLHDKLAMTGTKLACSRAVCGSCSILVDGVPKASCAMFAFELDGAEVTTIEGIAAAGHPLVEAFARKSAFQCGYCTSGMIVLAKALLDREPQPERSTVVEWLSSNICRCTGYESIIDAVMEAARVDAR